LAAGFKDRGKAWAGVVHVLAGYVWTAGSTEAGLAPFPAMARARSAPSAFRPISEGIADQLVDAAGKKKSLILALIAAYLACFYNWAARFWTGGRARRPSSW